MAITPDFNLNTIDKMIQAKAEAVIQAIILRLQKVGETFITNARNSGDYNDITGNLRSSIGYVILQNGKQLFKGGFGQVKEGAEGVRTGQKIIESILEKYNTGICLIVVAGMDYAAAVESKGRDVLTGSSQAAVIDLRKALEAVSRKVA